MHACFFHQYTQGWAPFHSHSGFLLFLLTPTQGWVQVLKKKIQTSNRTVLCPPCLQRVRSQLAGARSSHVSSLVGLCCGMHCLGPERLAARQGSARCPVKPEERLQQMPTFPSSVRTGVRSLQVSVGSQTPRPRSPPEDAGQCTNRNRFSRMRLLASYCAQGHYHGSIALSFPLPSSIVRPHL